MTDTAALAGPDEGKGKLTAGLYIRLSVMMFLQFAVWGAWYPLLAVHLRNMGFDGKEIGYIYALLPFACMVAPFVGGQLADRWIPTQVFLGVAHLVGGVGMLLAAPREDFAGMFAFILFWSLLYGPTLGLTNSLCFQHLPDGEKGFGAVRLWGTIGWIVVSVSLTLWLAVDKDVKLPSLLSWADGFVTWLASTVASVTGHEANPQLSDCLRFTGVLGIVMGVFCFFLPHTPPAKSGEKPWAFLEALKLLKNPQFAFLMVISFVVSTELGFFFQLTGLFLSDPNASIQIEEANVPITMILGQAGEIFTMMLVGWFLLKFGIKGSLAIGILAWPVRYAVFAIGGPDWLVIGSLPIHGLCFVCFFVVAFIYVDKIAPPDIRGSAQSLLIFVLYGLGMFVGALFAGWIQDLFTVDDVINWRNVFLVPVGITTACAIVFFVGFKEPPKESAAAE